MKTSFDFGIKRPGGPCLWWGTEYAGLQFWGFSLGRSFVGFSRSA